LEVSGAVGPIYGSLGVKRLRYISKYTFNPRAGIAQSVQGLGYGAGISGFRFPDSSRDFVFSEKSWPNPEPTQPLAQRVPGLFVLWVKRTRREVTTHFHPVSRLRMSGAIPPRRQDISPFTS